MSEKDNEIEFSDEIVRRQNKLLQELQNFTKKHTSDDLIDGVMEEDTITTFLLFKLAQMEYVIDNIPSIVEDIYKKFELISDELKKLRSQ